MLCCQKRRLRKGFTFTFQYLKAGDKEDGNSFFFFTKGNGYKSLLGRFQLDTGIKCFTIRKISHWNNHPKVVVDSPTLDNFKIQLDKVLGHLV